MPEHATKPAAGAASSPRLNPSHPRMPVSRGASPDSTTHHNDDGPFAKTINNIIFYALLLLIVLAPIPFGSNRPWSWSLCALITSVLTLAWAINACWNKQKISLSLTPMVIVLFLIPCTWAFLQASTLLPESWTHPLWPMTAAVLGESVTPTISLAPDNTITAVMRLLSYGLIFFLTFQYCRNRNRAETTLKWIAVAGVVYALYGLISYWGQFNTIHWYEGAASNGVTSTFINRNSYATYAGLGLLCLMSLFLRNSAHQARKLHAYMLGRQQRIERFIITSWLPLLGMMLITTALITTYSRGGFISTAVAAGLLLALFGIRKKVTSRTLLAAIGGLFVILLLAFSISSETLLKRMDNVLSDVEGRLDVYELTTNAVKDSPWTGFGYGAFREGFRLYRSEEIPGVIEKTHNTYIENSFELGIPAAVSLFLALIGMVLIATRGVFHRRRDWLYPATGIAATVLVAIHSFVDFSLQIPAIAIVFSAIIGAALAQATSPNTD